MQREAQDEAANILYHASASPNLMIHTSTSLITYIEVFHALSHIRKMTRIK
ncbi:hypothetical protein BofuT4_P058610.1 [Botrytis cinerea T4]|uniref:Uncharacterized protein n=1 Tax=Botryotinia fuckeliana (strain T4) TaxID=999810 RepID=G2XUW1_BOTF4|nr:hypothetical protein BofuT4_P058610.1 [Botrytis cinerea T4]